MPQDWRELKIDVPEAHYDRLASPVATLVMITTVDNQGRINAASFATCLRNNHKRAATNFRLIHTKIPRPMY